MLTAAQIRKLVIHKLESLERVGVTHLHKAVGSEVTNLVQRPAASGLPPKPQAAAASPVRVSQAAVQEAAPLFEGSDHKPPLSPAERLPALQVIRDEVAGCTRCPELAATRTQTVFGVGKVNPRLCFLGEAPGADEDKRGEPFVGRAGLLLTDIIVKGCKLPREEVYILNVLKCRPPGNRPPEPDEVSNCRGYLVRQLEVLRPEFICCLGVVASQALLNTATSIGRLRGRFHDYRGTPVVCTYHPAYLLRNPAAKKDVWDDIKMLLGRMQ